MINHNTLVAKLSILAELQIAFEKEAILLDVGDLFSPEGDECSEQMLNLQDDILTYFALPFTPQNMSIIYFEVFPSYEEIKNRIIQLHLKAAEYLSREVKSEIQILEEALKFNHNFADILPELYIKTSFYAIFVFDEILLKKQDKVENILAVLKFANESEIVNALGILILSENEKIRREKYEFLIIKKEVKYIDKYIEFYISNPIGLKETINLFPSISEDIFHESTLNQTADSEIEISFTSQNKILSTQKDIANELIRFFLENKKQFGYINLNSENKYDGWVGNFHIYFSNGQKMSLDLKEEKDKFLLFVLAVVWSRTGQWENAAFFVTYLKFFEKNDPKYWQIKSNVKIEAENRKRSKEKILEKASSINASRKEISFREDIFESVHILANNWEDILSSLTSSYHNNNYVPFMKKMRGIEGLAGMREGKGKNMSIKIPLILRELRCQKIFDNIPGEFCCVADERVVKACKKIGIKLPNVTREIPNLITVSTKIYTLFGDLYDLPLFAVKDIS